MLKNLGIYALIIGGLVLLYISTSQDVMHDISAKRNDTTAWWGVHNSHDKGDLVNMSYLDYVTKFHSDRDYVFHQPAIDTPKAVNLYLHGDSYTFKIPDTAFAGLNRYEYAWVYNKHLRYTLDTTKINILILEHTERFVTTFYSGLDLLKLVYDSAQGNMYDQLAPSALPQPVADNGPISSRFNYFFGPFFNSHINQNIEYNLFNYNATSAPRLAKASLNYYLFGRASGDVVVSKKYDDQLYIRETTDATKKGSSYVTIDSAEYNTIARNLDILYNHYRRQGFDEVYLSVIPNPATILEPKGYNMLIPRLQRDRRLKMKCIDMYTIFAKQGRKVYRPGDTHWNNAGAQIWLNVINDTLKMWNARALENSVPVVPAAQ